MVGEDGLIVDRVESLTEGRGAGAGSLSWGWEVGREVEIG